MAKMRAGPDYMTLLSGAAAVAMLLLCVTVPHWAVVAAGTVPNYPVSRHWGLFVVTGQVLRTHSVTQAVACAAAAKNQVLNCRFGLCNWYLSKCSAWRRIKYSSYIAATGLTLAIFALLIVTFSSFSSSLTQVLAKGSRVSDMSMKALKLNLALLGFALFAAIASVTQLTFVWRDAFLEVAQAGKYPQPDPSVCFYMFFVGLAFLLIALTKTTVTFWRCQREVKLEKVVQEEMGSLDKIFQP